MMRILWVCNKCPKPIAELIGIEVDSLAGWLDYTALKLINSTQNEFHIIFKYKTEIKGKFENIYYYSFADDRTFDFSEIIDSVKADIIHIWGTEYKHTYYVVCSAEEKGVVNRCIISIQGLVSVYGRYHYTEGLPSKVIKSKRLRDYLWPADIMTGRKKYIERGEYEKKAIRKCNNIIGRTDWDRAISYQYNPQRNYFFCNESLRDSFYTNKWDIGKIKRHTIFVSQCSYPIKGFHYMLEALSIVLKSYPDAEVYTTGKDLFSLSIKERLKMKSYEAYLVNLINKYQLQGHVHFLGELTEERMCKEYLRAHVFVSPSTIENSPNSLGEAMLLGCPSVSSDVGGVKNMMTHERDGYIYQSSAPYMCAYYICKIFESDDIALEFSKNARLHAGKIFDRENNYRRLMDIYQSVNKI